MFDTLNRLGASGAGTSYEIERSLRFNRTDSAALTWTPSSAGNRKTWTFSCWLKRSSTYSVTSDFEGIFGTGTFATGTSWGGLYLDNNESLVLFDNTVGQAIYTTRKLRDTSAWYHIVVYFSQTDAESKIYINGVAETDYSTDNKGSNSDGNVNNTTQHFIGRDSGGYYFNGQMAEIHFVDGTALAASNFGEFDEVTGAWVPKEYTGSHGTNGFYLNFSDNSNTTSGTLGDDDSANSNDWTPTNFSVASGIGNDSLTDTPTNNHCVLNQSENNGTEIPGTISNGGLTFTADNNYACCPGTMSLKNGKYYWEVTYISGTQIYGINHGTGQGENAYTSYDPSDNVPGLGIQANNGTVYGDTGSGATDGGVEGTSINSLGTNDIMAFASDIPNGTLKVYKGTSGGSRALEHTFTGMTTTLDWFPAVSGYAGSVCHVDFGQQGFTYTPPTGYVALCTENLDAPTIKDPTKHFGVLTYTGNEAASRTISDTDAVDFTPDLVWVKNRDATAWHIWSDSARGHDGHTLYSNRQEGNYDASGSGEHGHISAAANGGFVATDSDGTVGINLNNSSDKYVAWCWKGNGGTNSANSDGATSSTVQVNASAGFSMVKWTGTGSATTIGHGLGVTPEMIIVKALSRSDNWMVYHKTSGNTHYFQLNENTAETDFAAAWNDTSPTSSVFTVGSDASVNGSTETYIAYVFSSVEGFSKVGVYNGNGGDIGTFVYTGFKPAFVMMKDKTSAGEWSVYDNSRMSYNVMQKQIRADADDVENDHAVNRIDFLANGWKMRDDDAGKNAARAYIYIAFAETPFKYATAR